MIKCYKFRSTFLEGVEIIWKYYDDITPLIYFWHNLKGQKLLKQLPRKTKCTGDYVFRYSGIYKIENNSFYTKDIENRFSLRISSMERVKAPSNCFGTMYICGFLEVKNGIKNLYVTKIVRGANLLTNRKQSVLYTG